MKTKKHTLTPLQKKQRSSKLVVARKHGNIPKTALPTPEQIKAEIEALKAIKPNIIKHSAFGDDHHAAIDAQIDVLEHHLTNNLIFDKYEDEEDLSQNVLDSALDAMRWRDEEDAEKESLVSEWATLRKRP